MRPRALVRRRTAERCMYASIRVNLAASSAAVELAQFGPEDAMQWCILKR
jgi:hypothetical protein